MVNADNSGTYFGAVVEQLRARRTYIAGGVAISVGLPDTNDALRSALQRMQRITNVAMQMLQNCMAPGSLPHSFICFDLYQWKSIKNKEKQIEDMVVTGREAKMKREPLKYDMEMELDVLRKAQSTLCKARQWPDHFATFTFVAEAALAVYKRTEIAVTDFLQDPKHNIDSWRHGFLKGCQN